MLHFVVPGGIGDFLAMYLKLVCLKRDDQIIISPSGDGPRRLLPLLTILPRVTPGGYHEFSNGDVMMQTLPPGTDLETLDEGDYCLSINKWLEGGGTVDSWVPGRIDYHPPFATPDALADPVFDLLERYPDRPLVGIYTSAYGNSRHWGFWGVDQWWEFLNLVFEAVPKETLFIFLGAEYDGELSPRLMQKLDRPYVDTLGKFHIGATTELIRRLDYFFVFPSGLGFIADMTSTPNLMWFPKHLAKMAYTFVDPEHKDSLLTLHQYFETPLQAFEKWCVIGRRHFQERMKFHLG